MLLPSCGQQNNLSQSSLSSSEENKSQVQSDVSVSEPEKVEMRQVLIKRTKYDATDNVLSWREYNYNTENQGEWKEYDVDGKLLGHGLEQYDNDWNLIEELRYNSYDILTWDEKFNVNGDTTYLASYSENGTLDQERSYTYNEDGKKDSETVCSKSPYRESNYAKYIIKSHYDDSGAPQRDVWEYLDVDEPPYNYRLYTCDESNRIIKKIIYLSDGTIMWIELYQYDEYGNIVLKQSEYEWSEVISTDIYTYDQFGNCLSIQHTESSYPEDNYSRINTYDENGFVLRETHEENEGTWYYSFEYDMIPVSSK